MPWGYTQPGNWKTTRRRILTRDQHACHLCGAPAHEVDHIVSVAQGGSHEDNNLAAICTTHHETKTQAERTAGIRRSSRTRSKGRQAEQHPGVLRHM